VDLVAQLDHSTDHKTAISMLKERLKKIPNVVAEPVPDVEVLTFTPMGPVLAVRPYVHNDSYWQVYFDTNKLIRESFGEAGYAAPQQHFQLHNK
jgi:small conductance mechanosensitive channel